MGCECVVLLIDGGASWRQETTDMSDDVTAEKETTVCAFDDDSDEYPSIESEDSAKVDKDADSAKSEDSEDSAKVDKDADSAKSEDSADSAKVDNDADSAKVDKDADAAKAEKEADRKLRAESYKIMARVGNFGLFLVIAVIFGWFIGNAMDKFFGTKPVFIVFWIVAAVASSILELVRSVKAAKKLGEEGGHDV